MVQAGQSSPGPSFLSMLPCLMGACLMEVSEWPLTWNDHEIPLLCTFLCLVYLLSLCQTLLKLLSVHTSSGKPFVILMALSQDVVLLSLCPSLHSTVRAQGQALIALIPGSSTRLITKWDSAVFKKRRKTRGKEEVWIFVVLMGIEDGSFVHSLNYSTSAYWAPLTFQRLELHCE